MKELENNWVLVSVWINLLTAAISEKKNDSEIGRLKESYLCYSEEYKSIKVHGWKVLIDWNIV